MNLSLRARLVIVIVVLITCGLAVADVVGVALLRSYLLERIDQQLSFPRDRAARTERRLPALCDVPANSATGIQLPTDFVLTTFDFGGAEECQLPRQLSAADSPDLSSLTSELLSSAADSGAVLTVPGRDGAADWRARVVRMDTDYLVTAISTAEIQATVHRLALVTTGTSLVILLLAASGGWLLVRIGLRPLTAIETTAASITRGDFSSRVDAAPPNTEVGRLATALNTMLAKIEQALAARSESEGRLRQFIADASHELRTPIATIRGHAELYRQGAVSHSEPAGTSLSPELPLETSVLMDRIESEAIRMGALVEDMLLLARMDSAPQLKLDDVDLLSVAAEVMVDARAQAPNRTIVLRPRPPSSAGVGELDGAAWQDEPPVVRGDQARLHQVLANLISNAIRHTPADRPIEVEIGVLHDQVHCRVIDHGPGLEPETAARIFERFYRGDASRTRQTGGAGLGLAIVASLVQAHDGQVGYQPTPGGGSTFIVILPLAAGEPSPV